MVSKKDLETLSELFQRRDADERVSLDIKGILKFTDDTDYWQNNSFPFVFQNVTSFFKLGGNDVFIYGGMWDFPTAILGTLHLQGGHGRNHEWNLRETQMRPPRPNHIHLLARRTKASKTTP